MDLNELNKTELTELFRIQTGRRLSRSLSNDELITAINTGEIVRSARTEKTRMKLEKFIAKNWDFYQTNLPCRGQVNEGKCSVFRCPEGRHIDCYLNVKDQLDKEEG